MAAGGGGQDQNADKNAYYILWLIFLVVLVCGMIWYFFSHQLKQFFIWVRLYELMGLAFFFGLIPASFPWIGESMDKLYKDVHFALDAAEQLTPATLNPEIAGVLSDIAGEYLRWPVGVYVLVLCMMIFKLNVHIRLKHKFNMKTLAEQEQVNWPQIKIATKHDILNEDLDAGPWAMAMSPIQFSKKNKLVAIEAAEASQSPFSKMQLPEYTVVLDKVRAERAFSVQMGRTWQGVEAMPPHRRAIFAVFVARGCRDGKGASSLVAQLADSAADGTVNCSGADELWKKHFKTKRVQEICGNHAYEFTVFISILLFAREDGVVASADFLWVKPLDRRLWYVINNVGRQTPSVEVGGIFSHWYHEMALKRPLSAPRVDEAVRALEIALSELNYVPDPKEKEEIMKRKADRDQTQPVEQPA